MLSAHPLCACYMFYNFILRDLIAQIISDERYKLGSSTSASCYALSLQPNIILSTLLSGITLYVVYSALTDAERIPEG